ncbi:MAG: hypothetical protein IJR14_06335 [Synergistaceae bacterium]|nr:hypothetical protein [Synergistaceae bacterium]
MARRWAFLLALWVGSSMDASSSTAWVEYLDPTFRGAAEVRALIERGADVN